ncbi:MAG: response regulator [Candidatus Binatia bacterium]
MDGVAAKIMVVEDEPDLLRLVVQILTNAGFVVIQAYGGEDALRKVKLHRPDLIITDLAMPLMSGVEIIGRVKRDPQTQAIPCIAVTAYTWDQIASAASDAGCDVIVPKPFTAPRLLQEIAKFVPLPLQVRATGR